MLEKYNVFTGLFFGALWVLLCYGFVAEELMPPLLLCRSAVQMLCDIIFLILGVYSLRKRVDVIIVASFLMVALVSIILNQQGVVFSLNGLRDFFGLIFAVPICRLLLRSRHREKFVASFDRQLLIFLFIQLFCVTWQFIKYGPGDHGGGSMGEGFSGIVSTLIYLISFYLISKRWTFGNYWRGLADNKLYIFLLFPTFLNETKISFIFLLAYFLLLLKVEKKTLGKLFLALPLIIIGMFVSGYVYLSVTGQTVEKVFSQDAMNRYMIGEDPDELIDLAQELQYGTYDVEDLGGDIDIPRFTKIGIAPFAAETAKGGIWFGAGVGQFKGGTTLDASEFATEWNWLLYGSIPYLFFIFIQLGIVGTIWFFADIFLIMSGRVVTTMGLNIKIFIWIIIILVLFYNDSLRFFPECAIMFYILLMGYDLNGNVSGRTEDKQIIKA
ncbi:MAG: hypothetical protein NC212_00385 [Staphylococcus sp.]|nr:hypothetical protein [Staphylococcus sp.]